MSVSVSVCECECERVSVCECERVWVCVSECVSVCMCVCVQHQGNTRNFQNVSYFISYFSDNLQWKTKVQLSVKR